MYKCAMNVRPPQDPTVGKQAIILVPSRRRSHNSVERESTVIQPQSPLMNRATTIIFWNIRGANNDDFRRNFRDLIDTHKPCLVALLETRMHVHAPLLHEFNFSELIEVLAEGQSGGMVVLYNHDTVTVEHFTRNGQEIHTLLQVHPFNFSWLFTAIYASTQVQPRDIMWKNIKAILQNYKGPWMLGVI